MTRLIYTPVTAPHRSSRDGIIYDNVILHDKVEDFLKRHEATKDCKS
jgi:hypothetical protein